MTTSKEVIEFAKQNDAVMVDLKFIDFIGTWQHFTIPVSEMNEEMMEEERRAANRIWQWEKSKMQSDEIAQIMKEEHWIAIANKKKGAKLTETF